MTQHDDQHWLSLTLYTLLYLVLGGFVLALPFLFASPYEGWPLLWVILAVFPMAWLIRRKTGLGEKLDKWRFIDIPLLIWLQIAFFRMWVDGIFPALGLGSGFGDDTEYYSRWMLWTLPALYLGVRYVVVPIVSFLSRPFRNLFAKPNRP